jgi:cysteine desulfurase
MIEPEGIIYLDNNATTRIDPAVVEEMRPFLEKYYGNPSSGYRFGAQVRSAIDLARERVAALLGCTPGEVVFTGCGTESNNSAIHSALQLDPSRRHVVTTQVEHSATLRFCEELARRGCEATFVGVDENGNIDLEQLESGIRSQTALVSAMWANNETGVLSPIDKIAEIARRKRVLFHVDAIQAVGKLPISVRDLPLNFLSVSAHKLHGPKGVGALYVNRQTAFRPMLLGGGQEEGRRSGTENVASIVGFGKAAELALQHVDEQQTRVRALRDRFEAALQAELTDTFVNGADAPRLPNTSHISFSGIDAGAVLILLDQQGICCSAGSACRTGSQDSSHVLRAMKLSEERMRGSLRFSLGRMNTEAEVERATPVITRAVNKLRGMSALS